MGKEEFVEIEGLGVASSVDMSENGSIISSILETIKKSQNVDAVRSSLDVDPMKANTGGQLFKTKYTGLPCYMLKRIRDTEEMVGGIILPTRSRQVSLFFRPRANRFDIGFSVNLKPWVYAKYNPEEQKKIKDEIVPKLQEILMNCGSNSGVKDQDRRTFSQWAMEIVEDALTFGWFGTEVIKDEIDRFHSFRAVDAGTINPIIPQDERSKMPENLRREAERTLAEIKKKKVSLNRHSTQDYTWVQVINGKQVNVFSDEELLMWYISPSTDVERNGFPISPLDRVISAVSTHINLTTHNQMYFLNGKAAKNVFVFKSENVEKADIEGIRAQMTAHINSSNAAWRMPVFGIGAQDAIEVHPLDGGTKDMEFQYMADLNKRMLLAAYQMSPDEIAALSYLSRGTNSQALSEANNEYKLIASRDLGLRPLCLSIEDFLNERLLPQINKEWAKLVHIGLEGLDADSKEKESTLIQGEMAIHATMNDICDRVEKDPMPIAGDFPLNNQYLMVMEKYFTKGQILKAFGGDEYKEADKNPDFQYYMNDPVWLQLYSMKMQQAQMQQAQEQQAQAQQMQGGDPQAGQGGEQAPQEDQGPDLGTAMGQLSELLGKAEKIPAGVKRSKLRKDLHLKHEFARKKILKEFEEDSKNVLKSIIDELKQRKENK